MYQDLIYTSLAQLGPDYQPRSSLFSCPLGMSLIWTGHLAAMYAVRLTECLSQIIGGSRFSPTYNFEDLTQSLCSTGAVQQDLSNYWAVS